MNIAPLFLIFFLILTPLVPKSSGQELVFDMDTIRHRPGEVTAKDNTKVAVGSVELGPGKFGQAVKFSFPGDLGAGFMTAAVLANEAWDQSAGLSFYLKCDGSTNWGGLELIDRADYGLRFGFCFPLDSTDWRKIVVPWRHLTPELSGPMVDTAHGYKPSRFGNLWFGKWFYWRDYPAHSFVIDQVVLEKSIDPEPVPPVAASSGLKRVQAKIRAGQPITVVTMGDSLSDKRHWANRQVLWSEELTLQIKERFGTSAVLVNPALGGTTLSQNLVLIPRWLRDTPQPDLVTIWFGYNDWDTGVRGQRFKEYLLVAVDRVRRQTQGSADLLLLTTCPAFKRWDVMAELEQAVRDVAREKQTGLADIAQAFRRLGTAEEALTKGCWAWDNTHLGTNGHKLAAQTVLDVLAPLRD